jgi:uncharacterized protein YegL
MSYKNTPVGTTNPGLIMILIDQSGSMEAPYEGSRSKAEFAALAVNRCIQSILEGCKSMEKTKDRCYVLVVGYGAPNKNPKAGGQKAYLIVGGKISEVETQRIRLDTVKKKEGDGAGGLIEIDFSLGIWVEPCVEGDTPMEDAFKKAEEYASQWVLEHPNNYPPIVINITDGQPNDSGAAESAARALMKVATSDGNLLLFNAHIGDGQKQVILPTSESALSDQFEKLMFRLSSEIPPSMFEFANKTGLPVQTGSRGAMINANAENLVKMIELGSTTMK